MVPRTPRNPATKEGGAVEQGAPRAAAQGVRHAAPRLECTGQGTEQIDGGMTRAVLVAAFCGT